MPDSAEMFEYISSYSHLQYVIELNSNQKPYNIYTQTHIAINTPTHNTTHIEYHQYQRCDNNLS